MSSDTSDSESDDGVSVIVIDNGTRTLKAGFGGDDSARAIFSSVVGLPKRKVRQSYAYTIMMT